MDVEGAEWATLDRVPDDVMNRIDPFPSFAFEVLFVSRNIGVPNAGRAGGLQPAGAPNNPGLPDWQVDFR